MRKLRRGKFGNIKTVCGAGEEHHSKKEAARCDELHLMQDGGLIQTLSAHPQPDFKLEVKGTKVCKYVADFTYWERGKFVVEDVKGRRTAVYNLKKKLMSAIHGISIRET